MNKFIRSFLFAGFLSASMVSCGSPDAGLNAGLSDRPTIGLKTMWAAGRSTSGRKQIIYCPINARLPQGYFASRLAGDCSMLQGGQRSGVTALYAEEIRPADRVLCIVKNSDMPSGWQLKKGPFGTISCGSNGVQIQKN